MGIIAIYLGLIFADTDVGVWLVLAGMSVIPLAEGWIEHRGSRR